MGRQVTERAKGAKPRAPFEDDLDELASGLAGAGSPEDVASALGRFIRNRRAWRSAALVWPGTAGTCRAWALCAPPPEPCWKGLQKDVEDSTEVGPSFAAPLLQALRAGSAVRVDSGPEDYAPYLLLLPASTGRRDGETCRPPHWFASLFRMAARLHSLNSLLLNAKAQWEKAFDAAAEVFVLHGPDGRILRANTALSALTGLPIRQCIGRTCMEILPGLCAGHDSAGTDWRHPGSGADFLVMTQTVNLGGEAATLHVLRNVTEERRLSAIEEDRRRSAFVRDILQGIAHEIRNPIFGIQTLLQALDIRHSHDDQERAFTEKALREIHRLDGIVRRFLQLAFLEDASPLETAPVEDLVSQAATLVESRSPTAKTDRIRLSPSLRGRTAQVHRQSFVEALAEILDNACLYSPPDASVEVSGRWDGDGWEMRIRDEGPGVPYGFEERIFEPFFTTAPSRSGLGLALARAGLARDGGRTGLLREEGSRGAIILIRFSK